MSQYLSALEIKSL